MLDALWTIAQVNYNRLLDAFRAVRLSESDLWGSTGYGLDDLGRDKLENVYFLYFGAEDALVRPNISSGTHASYLVASSLGLKDKSVLFTPFEPYDSVFENIRPLLGKWSVWNGQDNSKADVLWLQRSGGYRWFEGLNITQMQTIIERFHSINPNGIVVVDNCYGEFVEEKEPTHVGADLCFGSLIKNPGGTITPTGAYVVGKQALVERVSKTLFGPALADEQGATGPFLHSAFHGLFLAPLLVYNSLVSKEKLVDKLPNALEERFPFSDIIVRTRWETKEKMISAAQLIQHVGPVNSYVTLEPFAMGGYKDPIVMAWTGFVQGESLSLSADGTVSEPFELFIQPGVNPFIIEELSAKLNSIV
ncbi:methionine gamma-lyase family protein [Coprothermobacter platensis]|jgi:cystathionine beta-lyase family protein involved in aluminum resistance|uniref:methionine gamma-lyase family protein n=1 Tax=Coprothermobacter platensis TaxID=108819 RepID=UPI000375CC1A|nr:methionine gamma-lyase family protein [Coprothermobacter platensis]